MAALVPPRHSAAAVLSPRHSPSWLLLAAAAGGVNAGAFTWAERFVSHLTGAVTQLRQDSISWAMLFESAFIPLAFIIGAAASVLALQARSLRGEKPAYAAPLLVVTALISIVAVLGHLGVATSEAGELALLGVLALAMGLMNASVGSSTAHTVRTTHMTGPATDFGVQLGVAWFTAGRARLEALRLAWLRGGKLLAFIVGALAIVPLTRAVGAISFLAPALLVLIATRLSFSSEATEGSEASQQDERTSP